MNEWISVREKLPKAEENVLIYFEDHVGNGISIGFCNQNRFIDAYHWTEIPFEKDCCILGVTYWMPLPKPPHNEPKKPM
jgi:uncharacterized protein DUF551